jgi:hypothetical protein
MSGIVAIPIEMISIFPKKSGSKLIKKDSHVFHKSVYILCIICIYMG